MSIFISPALIPIIAAQGAQADYPIMLWEQMATSVVADSENVFAPAINLLNPSTIEGWTSESLLDQYITFSVDGELDAVGIAKHNLGSGDVVVSVEGLSGEVGAVWTELYPETLVATDRPHVFRFVPTLLASIRIRVQPQGATFPSIAVAYVGRSLQLELGVQPGHTPVPFARRREVINGRNENQDFLGRLVISESRSTSVDVKGLDPDWYRDNLDAVFDALGELPFFWVWRPQTYPDEVGFVWCTNDPVPVPAHLAGYIDINLQLEGKA